MCYFFFSITTTSSGVEIISRYNLTQISRYVHESQIILAYCFLFSMLYSYFHCSLIGYFLGLLTATVSSEVFKAAQPALLYLVPFTLLPLLTMAYLKVGEHFFTRTCTMYRIIRARCDRINMSDCPPAFVTRMV